ncbi:CBS domain-containing protein CBSX6 [Cardamine amara subsp. amara]|uniref:CBS domain-containing protein CBSX6 n=1 Tax=Cardamine amara subsp. amara TaxID=228776 RepID=A0ABD1BLB5_CARAN
MASVFLYHVVGDLTVGKPEMVEFYETETVESAIRAIGESTECGIPVWRKRSTPNLPGFVENSEMRQHRFVGILNSLDIVAFLAKSECLQEEKAMKIPVSEVVSPNNTLLKQVDPGTRLIDALEMMKQGVRRLLVPKSVVWRGMSKRFSILYNGKWLKNNENSSSSNGLATDSTNRPTTSMTSSPDKFCCLSREDVIRFLIAIEATRRPPCDPSAIAVLEQTENEQQFRIIGEISASKLWKCDYLAAAWALANLYAGQFVMGVEDNMSTRSFNDFLQTSFPGGEQNGITAAKAKKFSSRSIGFNPTSPTRLSIGRSMYRGRSAPLTCKTSSSLAAVMAQMLSHRATHVWVTEADSDDVLVGVVGYGEILNAVTKQPSAFVTSNRPYEGFGNENQS